MHYYIGLKWLRKLSFPPVQNIGLVLFKFAQMKIWTLLMTYFLKILSKTFVR